MAIPRGQVTPHYGRERVQVEGGGLISGGDTVTKIHRFCSGLRDEPEGALKVLASGGVIGASDWIAVPPGTNLLWT